MIKRILLAYDGSTGAGRALDFALDLALKHAAELHVLTVARPPEFGDDVETRAMVENARQHYDRVLGPVKARVAGEAFKTIFHVAVGHPAEQIVRYAEAHAIDHVVVGHRGHTLFERWLIGSVARQVIAHAHCSVTVQR